MTYTDVLRHYEALIDEGNDPVCDPPELQEYMDLWDGEAFMKALTLTGDDSVLEIGVGTGRLAVRIGPFAFTTAQPYYTTTVNEDGTKTLALTRLGRLAVRIAPGCRRFTGIDLSSKTIARAGEHLAGHGNAALICGDFLTHEFREKYDVICSSLTFMHLEDKAGAARRISSLLHPGGRAVISIDKDQSGVIDYGERKVKVYPDTPEGLEEALRRAGLTVGERRETPFAWIVTARLQS